MKLFAVLVFLTSLFAAACAQNITIGYPADGSSVSANSSLTVQVNRPNSLTGSQEIAIVISMAPCTAGGCPDPTERLGSILYYGPYNPQYPITRSPQDVPQQNFSVTVPAYLQQSLAQLTVTHFSLVGATQRREDNDSGRHAAAWREGDLKPHRTVLADAPACTAMPPEYHLARKQKTRMQLRSTKGPAANRATVFGKQSSTR
ncbi:hypothetical protein EW146_g9617, partial [Bondarzewia mesenterica]